MIYSKHFRFIAFLLSFLLFFEPVLFNLSPAYATTGGGGFNSPSVWWDSGATSWTWSNLKYFSGDFNGDGKRYTLKTLHWS